MKVKLKPLADQVIVITGASSGIGLAAARMAAEQGARIVVAARSEGAAILMKRSNALLARPAEINRVDVLATKPG